MRVQVSRTGDREEIVPMAHSLNEDEDRPERGRTHGHEPELRAAVSAARRAGRKHRKDERKGRHHDQRRKPCSSSLDAEGLLTVRKAAEEHADAYDAVADDHHGSEDRVARQGRHIVAASNHHREDERGLNSGYGQGEYERAKRLAHAMRDDFGVVDRCDDRPYQSGAAQHGKQRSHASHQRGRNQSERQQGDEPGPDGHACTSPERGSSRRGAATYHSRMTMSGRSAKYANVRFRGARRAATGRWTKPLAR